MSCEIEINFENANRQARAIEELSNAVRSVANDYSDALRLLSNDWISENAALYMNKGDVLRTSIVNTAQDLEKIANNIRKTAQRIYDAEKASEELARVRTN